jgi:hypothetical protein
MLFHLDGLSTAGWLKYAEAAEIRQSMAKRVEERLSGSRTQLNLPLVVAIPAAAKSDQLLNVRPKGV